MVEDETISDLSHLPLFNRSQSFSGRKNSISFNEDENQDILLTLEEESVMEEGINDEKEQINTNDIENHEDTVPDDLNHDLNHQEEEETIKENEDIYLPPEEFFNVTGSPKVSPKKYGKYEPPPPFYCSISPTY